mmetsp:Transcript_72718/g.137435  ORF Transcript_72718/g.137435 Transcript_72718/m.137435 type:complete len:277 (-) Transcript_72718:21-851(-)
MQVLLLSFCLLRLFSLLCNCFGGHRGVGNSGGCIFRGCWILRLRLRSLGFRLCLGLCCFGRTWGCRHCRCCRCLLCRLLRFSRLDLLLLLLLLCPLLLELLGLAALLRPLHLLAQPAGRLPLATRAIVKFNRLQNRVLWLFLLNGLRSRGLCLALGLGLCFRLCLGSLRLRLCLGRRCSRFRLCFGLSLRLGVGLCLRCRLGLRLRGTLLGCCLGLGLGCRHRCRFFLLCICSFPCLLVRTLPSAFGHPCAFGFSAHCARGIIDGQSVCWLTGSGF